MQWAVRAPLRNGGRADILGAAFQLPPTRRPFRHPDPLPTTMIRTGWSSADTMTFPGKVLQGIKQRANKRTKFALKTLVGLVVLFAVGRHVVQTWTKLHEHGGAIRVEPIWLGLGLISYLVGLSAYGFYFHRVLAESPTPVGVFAALRSYLISHLGKYVPGKAMVVVMRVGLVVPHGARAATATFATLYETLVMMAAGSMFTFVGFLLAPADRFERWPVVAGLALSAMMLTVVDPLVFPRISRLLSRPLKGVGPDALPRFSRKLLFEGLLWSVVGWFFLGLSLVAVLRAFSAGAVPLQIWPMVIASVAFATVGGFVVAVLPGGLGVREGIIMATLKPVVGDELSVLAALALRLLWVLGELLAAAGLTAFRPRYPVKAEAS
ncbi:lysylphosphatidylglycerol synthase domain-containing protein [Singulisphaera rosea]